MPLRCFAVKALSQIFYSKGAQKAMTFTNERLAMQIQAGNTEACGALWEQEKRLLYMLCYGFYSRNKDACIRAGVTLEDLEQEAYFALILAAQKFDQERGAKFNSCLNLYVKKSLDEAIGRRKRQPAALDTATSIDAQLIGYEDFTLADTIPDTKAEQAFRDADDALFCAGFRDVFAKAASALPDIQRKAVALRYFGNAPYNQIAEALGVTYNQAKTETEKAIRTLRKDKSIKAYNDDVITGYAYHGTGLTSFLTHWASSVELASERTL